MTPAETVLACLAFLLGLAYRGTNIGSAAAWTIVIVVGLCAWWIWRSRSQLKNHPQQRELLLVDAGEDNGLEEAPTPIVVPWAIGNAPAPALPPGAPRPTVVVHATRFRRWAAASIRADTVLPTRSRANKLMVETVVKRFLEEHGVRKTHISQHLPVIVAMLFIPSKADVESRLLLGSSVALNQDALMRGSTWLQWFWGTKPLEFSK